MAKQICIFTTINADQLLGLLKRVMYADEEVERATLLKAAHELLNKNISDITDEMIICEIAKIKMQAKKQLPPEIKSFVRKQIIIFDDCDSTVAVYIRTGERHGGSSNHIRSHRSDRKL